MGFLNKETLCWKCKRPGTGTCAWDKSKGNTPVDGWKADVVPYRDTTGFYSTTYHVIDCPLFDLDEEYHQRMKKYLSECKQCGRKPKADIKRIEYLLKYGWTNKAIALQFGMSPQTVAKYRSAWRKKTKE